ncbi:hypothetical protein [Arthrobacter nitrophenolicus]|uniref:Uncharacterized protein n=2 Tax=Arthrobacter nitrophenolicus TaxID=683150 RepID=A0ACC6TDF2_9MICC|nr:hypothetical protein [Arthrobacter nitrophenolicus]ELT46005.1 hypothetical protein G205_02143 [Arthrobacter nitrophenolicus]
MDPGKVRRAELRSGFSRGFRVPASRRIRSAPARRTAGTSGADLSHSVLQWFAIIAPLTTIATALAFWFGWTMTSTRTAYFGIDQSVLEYSTVDYLLRSADALIVPAIFILLITIVCVAIHALTASIIRRGAGLGFVQIGAGTVLLAGISVTALGVWTMFEELPFAVPFLFEPAALGGGIAVSAYAFWVLRRVAFAGQRGRRLPMWEKLGYVSVVLLVVLALFWACSSYAGALGTGRSRDYARDLHKRPSVTVYSLHSLALGSSVREEKVTAPGAKYGFKYTGLKFVTLSSDKYFLLPADWSRGRGVAIVLEESPEYRVEFEPGEG